MRRSFILTYAKSLGTTEQVKEWADKSPLVITWRYEMWESIFLISEHSADKLCEDLIKTFGRNCRFIICEYEEDKGKCQGLLTPDSWHFLREKVHKKSTT